MTSPMSLLLLFLLPLVYSECPVECECDRLPPANQTLAVYCHKGGLNDTRFGELLLRLPANIKTFDVRSPTWRPSNKIKWNDNLNRFRDLKTLRLVNCQIPSMSRAVRLPNLEVLDLSYNEIDHATMGNFGGLSSLRILDLSHNKLSILPTGVFTYLKSLTSLSLVNNSMQDLPTNLLHGLRSLRSLHLDSNRLPTKHINDLFADVPQLEKLYLNDCGLNNLTKLSLVNVPQLTHLGLASNQMRQIPSTELEALPHLSVIDLSHNDISSVPLCAFCSNNLSRLDLSHNLLGISKEAFHPEAFRDSHLISLDLSFNHLNEFDSTVLGHAQFTIEEFGFSGNFLRSFPDEITHTLARLRRLHMANNHIDWWPVALPPRYHYLDMFNVSGNQLTYLPDNINLMLPNIVELDISNNRFSTLSQAALVFINDLDKVFLNENPWDCSCSIQHLQHHMKDRYALRHVLLYSQTKCSAPTLLQGQPLLNVEEVSDCAILFGARYGLTQSSELLILLAALMAAALILCVLLMALYYTRERQYKGSYVTREHSRTPLTMTHPMSMSPSNASEPLTPTMPPPPPKAAAAYFGI